MNVRRPEQRLFKAIKAADLECVQKLLAHDPSLINAQTSLGERPVMTAVNWYAMEVAGYLLEQGAELDLFEASALGDIDRIQELLRADARAVNTFCSDGWTALHLAAYYGQSGAATLLLACGADANTTSRNQWAQTPLHVAVAGRQRDLVYLLIARDAHLNTRDAHGCTPLHLAASEDHVNLARLLIESGADINVTRKDGATPLMTAMLEGHHKIADLIQRHGGQLWAISAVPVPVELTPDPTADPSS